MPRVTEVFAWVAADTGPNDETVLAYHGLPMFGADMRRVQSLRPAAQEISDLTGRPVKLLKFSLVEQIGELKPDPRARGNRNPPRWP